MTYYVVVRDNHIVLQLAACKNQVNKITAGSNSLIYNMIMKYEIKFNPLYFFYIDI